MSARRIVVMAAGLACLLASGAPVRAGVLFNTFNYDSGLGKDLYIEYVGGGIGYESGLSRGALFSPVATARLTSVEVAVSWSEGTRSFQAGIWKSDGTNGMPGTLVELLPVSNAMLNWNAWETPILLNSTVNSILSSSDSYWLVVSPVASDTKAAWNSSGYPSYRGSVYTHTMNPLSDGVSSAATLPAFRVNGSAVPEPTTWVSFSAGLVGLVLLARRQRSG